MIVRARVKAPELLPEWALCCPKIQEIHREEFESGEVFKVDTDSCVHSIEIRCPHCGSLIAEGRTGLEIVDGPAAFLLPELYDLDEGPAA